MSEDGTEFEVEDQVEYSLDGLERITSHWPSNVGHMTSLLVRFLIRFGTWTWDFALKVNLTNNKLYDNYTVFGRNNRVVSFVNKDSSAS